MFHSEYEHLPGEGAHAPTSASGARVGCGHNPDFRVGKESNASAEAILPVRTVYGVLYILYILYIHYTPELYIHYTPELNTASGERKRSTGVGEMGE